MNARTYLLAGLVQCGKCGSVLSGGPGVKNKSGNQNHAYICRKATGGCGGLSVQGGRVESIVLSIVRQALVVEGWNAPESTIDYSEQIRAVEEEIQAMRSDAQNGLVTYVDIRDMLRDATQKKRSLERLAAEQVVAQADYSPFGGWGDYKQASLSKQMSILREVVSGVVVLEAKSKKWDPERVTVHMSGGNVVPGGAVKVNVDAANVVAGFRDKVKNPNKHSTPVKNNKGHFVGNLPA